MADVGTKTIDKTYRKHNRTWRLDVDTEWVPNAAPASLQNHREIILVDPDDETKFKTEAKYSVVRDLADVADTDAPVIDANGDLQVLPAAATPDDFGVYDNGDGTFSVRLNLGLGFQLVAGVADAIGIAAPENPDNQ